MSINKEIKKIVNRPDASDLRKIEEMKKMGVVFGRKASSNPSCSLEVGATWFAWALHAKLIPGYNNAVFWYRLFERCFREEFA